MTRIVSAFLVSFVLIGLVACGGHSTPVPVATPTPPPTITVTPSSANVPIGGSQTFTTSTTGVTWSITGPGSISQNGVYVAPTTFPGTGANAVVVTATAGALKGQANATLVFPNDNAGNQTVPIKLGTSGGNVLDNSTDGKECCIGTLGSLIDIGGTKFILSNDHVLARSTLGNKGELIDQPGQPGCPSPTGTNVATLSQQALLKPATGTTGPAQSNVDAATAQIVAGTVDLTGAILDLGDAGATSILAAPPSSTPILPKTAAAAGEHVAKSGRTTGLTCSTIQAFSIDGVSVQYKQSCGGPVAFTATFNGQVAVAGGNFSAGGDSGSLIVTADTASPLALLFAGSNTATFANPILDSTDSKGGVAKGVFSALAALNGGTAPTFVGTTPHPVSCDPTAQVQSTQIGAQSIPVPEDKRQMLAGVRDRHAAELMALDPGIHAVSIGGSSDAPGEGVLVLHMTATPKNRIPTLVDGVRTRLVYEQGAVAPPITEPELDRGLAAKDNNRSAFIGQPGFQGIGVGFSDDAPGEAAIVIYTISGESHAPIPAVLDGVRTKIIDGDRIRASGWNPQLEHASGSCTKTRVQTKLKRILKQK